LRARSLSAGQQPTRRLLQHNRRKAAVCLYVVSRQFQERNGALRHHHPRPICRKTRFVPGWRESGNDAPRRTISSASRCSGIKHGSHICAFYETDDDLIDLVIPFLSSRADRDELCVWMMPESVCDAKKVRLARRRLNAGSSLIGRAISVWKARISNTAGHEILERKAARSCQLRSFRNVCLR
jgi:hypothetical protein